MLAKGYIFQKTKEFDKKVVYYILRYFPNVTFYATKLENENNLFHKLIPNEKERAQLIGDYERFCNQEFTNKILAPSPADIIATNK